MENKLVKYWVLALTLIVLVMGTQGNKLSNPKISIPLWTLLLDAENSEGLPRRLRTTRDSLPETFETSGLFNLNMSGSAQFSALQFKVLVDHLGNFGVSLGQIVVVDLREEPHAFLNGHAFTWYAKKAWWIQNDPVAFIIESEKKRLATLPLGQSVVLKYIAHKDDAGNVQRLTDHSYVVSSLMTEEQVVTEAGAHYVRLPVTDHRRPDDKDVDQFLSLVKSLPPQAWVHFHCRAGRGRTSTFMIMYDMIRNPKLSKKAIIDRQVRLGSLDVRLHSGPLKAHKIPDEELRNRFINLFYEYVNASDGYGKNSWSKWVMLKFLERDKNHAVNNAFSSTTVAPTKRVKSQ